MAFAVLKASAYLHHLHLGSPDPERLAGFYGDVMEMEVVPLDAGTWLCSGPGRRLLVSEGTAGQLKHAGFACRDAEALAELQAAVEAAAVPVGQAATPLMRVGGFAVTDPDGNQILFGCAAEEPPRTGLRGPLQHLTLATKNIAAMEAFYAGKLGFAVSDRVVNAGGEVMTCFMRSNHEHHTLGVFVHAEKQGIDHHSYEAGEWIVIRDWCDRFAARDIQLMWGPGRHGPGNNLFAFIVDPDGNWIEISAELEVMHDRPVKHWPHAERTLNLWGRGILRA